MTDIWQMPLYSHCGGITFGKEDTSAPLQIYSMKPSCRELLEME